MNRKWMVRILGMSMVSYLFVGCGNGGATHQISEAASCTTEAAVEDYEMASNVYYDMAETEEMVEDNGEIYQVINQDRLQGGECYSKIHENQWIETKNQAISTFAIDVDTASYTNARRYIEWNELPPVDSVRIEEFINYFQYDYPEPTGEVPFSIVQESMVCPWNDAHQLVLVGLQGKKLTPEKSLPSNLVFLIDVSGSMEDENKLPLLKQSFKILTSNLQKRDRISIVVYAGAAGIVLDGAEGNDTAKINKALESLTAGGSTAGAEGIELAYKLAQKYYIKNGNNRVIMATDGDFNVGPSSIDELETLISNESKKGIDLTTLGFGMGNYRDDMMEILADKGNGNYAYIDRLSEAEKVLGKELYGTLFTIAKDTKIQVEFNEGQVESYRLIGYENRALNEEDFENDQVDAGEMGAGHCVTALYEVNLKQNPSKDEGLNYKDIDLVKGDEYGLVKVRYKRPNEEESQLVTCILKPQDKSKQSNVEFASCVAEYGLLLRDSAYKENASFDQVIKRANRCKGKDEYRKEFVELVKQTRMLE